MIVTLYAKGVVLKKKKITAMRSMWTGDLKGKKQSWRKRCNHGSSSMGRHSGTLATAVSLKDARRNQGPTTTF